MIKNLLRFFLIILFFCIKPCFAMENYINTNLFKDEENINLNIFVEGDIDLYGFLGKINYDKNILELKECNSDKYNSFVDNDMLLLESINSYKDTIIATCKFKIKENIDSVYFNVTDISLSNSVNVIYNNDSTVNREFIKEDTTIENDDAIENEEIEKPKKVKSKTSIIIPIIATVVLVAAFILGKKYKLLVIIMLAIITTSLNTYATDNKIIEEDLYQIRNMLFKNTVAQEMYDYDSDSVITINDLILGLIKFNNQSNDDNNIDEDIEIPTPEVMVPENTNPDPIPPTPEVIIPEIINPSPTPTPPTPPTPEEVIPENTNPNPVSPTPEVIIDTTAPIINYCQTIIRNNETHFYIDSNDTDISKYVVNDNPNLTFTSTPNFTVTGEIKNAKVTVYDTSNNSSVITCWWHYDQVKPSGNGAIAFKEETDTLKVSIQLNERSGLDFYTTYIWVKNAYSQFKSEVPSNYGKDLLYPEKLMENAINTNNLQNKLVVGINASGYEGKGVYGNAPALPLVLSNGKVIRDFTTKGLGTPKYNTYGITRDNILKYYPYSGSSHTAVAQKIKNDGVLNTFGFVIRLVEDGKVVTSKTTRSVLQGICQINENNFVFVTDIYGSSRAGFTYKELANYMVSLGCKNGYNMDGGGSVQLIFKPSNGTQQKLITQNNRKIPDIIYFHQ